MRGVCLQLLILALAMGAGCGPAPARPYGHPDYVLRNVPVFRKNTTRAPAAHRTVVIGAFDDQSVGPVGGLYNDANHSATPLVRTYYYWAVAPKLLDELHTQLGKRGLTVFKDYLDSGRKVTYPRSHYPPNVLLLRGTIQYFSFSRQVTGEDVVLAQVAFRLYDGNTGRWIWRGVKQVRVRYPWRPNASDPFATAAYDLAGQLLGDRLFASFVKRGAR